MIDSMEKKGDVGVLSLSGNLDISKQTRFKEEIVKSLGTEVSRVVLNFKGVSFIDSACLGVLVSLLRRLKTQGGDVRICSPQEEVRSIFQITRMDRLFKMFDQVDEAVKSYSS